MECAEAVLAVLAWLSLLAETMAVVVSAMVESVVLDVLVLAAARKARLHPEMISKVMAAKGLKRVVALRGCLWRWPSQVERRLLGSCGKHRRGRSLRHSTTRSGPPSES